MSAISQYVLDQKLVHILWRGTKTNPRGYFIVRELDDKILRDFHQHEDVGNRQTFRSLWICVGDYKSASLVTLIKPSVKKKSRKLQGSTEQAMRASLRTGIMSLNLKTIRANSNELKKLRQQKVVGGRAPSSSMLSFPETAQLLDCYNKPHCALQICQGIHPPPAVLQELPHEEISYEDPPLHFQQNRQSHLLHPSYSAPFYSTVNMQKPPHQLHGQQQQFFEHNSSFSHSVPGPYTSSSSSSSSPSIMFSPVNLPCEQHNNSYLRSMSHTHSPQLLLSQSSFVYPAHPAARDTSSLYTSSFSPSPFLEDPASVSPSSPSRFSSSSMQLPLQTSHRSTRNMDSYDFLSNQNYYVPVEDDKDALSERPSKRRSLGPASPPSPPHTTRICGTTTKNDSTNHSNDNDDSRNTNSNSDKNIPSAYSTWFSGLTSSVSVPFPYAQGLFFGVQSSRLPSYFPSHLFSCNQDVSESNLTSQTVSASKRESLRQAYVNFGFQIEDKSGRDHAHSPSRRLEESHLKA